jgi:hypothetical protein
VETITNRLKNTGDYYDRLYRGRQIEGALRASPIDAFK